MSIKLTSITQKLKKSIENEIGFEPTDQQSELMGLLAEFMTSDEDYGFVLRGYAGTGKSTTVGALVRALKTYKISSVLLAPTGRAAKVISAYSGMDAFTIHKKIYYKAINRLGSYSFQLSPNIYSKTLFVVDEASMLSDKVQGSLKDSSLLEDLIKYVKRGSNCKVLFVGDVAQLPPVGDENSPALSPKALIKYNIKCAGYELTDVVRQAKDSGILFNATEIRKCISAGLEDNPIFNLSFDDIDSVNGYDLQEVLEDHIDAEKMRNVCVITRSNKRAIAFNQQIRSRIFWHEEKLVEGEMLMIVKNNYFWTNSEEVSFIANGDLVEVVRIHKYIDRHGFRFAEVTLAFIDYEGSPEYEVMLMVDSLEEPHPAMPRDKMKTLWENVMLDYQDEKNLGVRRKKAMTDPFMNALIVKYGYAFTCHKSQGGQWSTVFVDHGYLTEEMMGTSFLRWLYTALTRATTKVFLVNFHRSFLPED